MVKATNKWKWAFFVSTATLLTICAFLLYVVIDQSVTITYMSQGYDDTEKDLERLAATFPKDTYTKKDVVYVLRQRGFNFEVHNGLCSLRSQMIMHQLCWRFEAKRLSWSVI